MTYHADEETRLLCGAPDARVADDADSETSRETSETDRETGAELHEAHGERHLVVHCAYRPSV